MANARGNNSGRFYSFLNQPVLIDCNFIVDPANGNGLGIRSLKGNGVKNVFMHTTATPGKNRGYTNPNPASGYALIQLDSNYNRYAGGFSGWGGNVNGSVLDINGTALTIGNPYVIVNPGSGPVGSATIAPVADVSGSLASTWFSLYDTHGNTFIIWFSVSGVGRAPIGVSGTLVQQSISTNDTAATIGADLVNTINNLPVSPGSSQLSFTATGTTTVTVNNIGHAPLPGVPMDGLIPTGFTFALVNYNTNLTCWQGVGVPLGIQPQQGVAFIATATGVSVGGGSSGIVEGPSVSGIFSIEVVGDPNTTLAPGPMGGSPHNGGFLVVQLLAPTVSGSAYQTPMIPTAPNVNVVCGMSFYVEFGSVVLNGE